jgi:hypothetical protein
MQFEGVGSRNGWSARAFWARNAIIVRSLRADVCGASIRWLRRLCAILLLTVFGLPLASPLFALSRSAGEHLPACCRRGGKHSCGGAGTEKGTSAHAPQFGGPAEKCPFSSQVSAVAHHAVRPSGSGYVFAPVVRHACGLAQTESLWRISRDRSSLKRGPPAPVLS